MHFMHKTQKPKIISQFGFEFEETRTGKSYDYRDVINFFYLQDNENHAFSSSSGVKSVFEKFNFLDG